MNLTKRRIEAAVFDSDGPGQQIIWDEKLENFGLRLYKSGAKSFVIRYRNEHGRRRYMTLGKFGVLTLQQARDLARQKLVEAAAGDDPAQARRRARQADTVRELVDTFIEKYSKPRKKTWKSDRSRLKAVISAWGSRSPVEITHSDVAALHRSMSDTPYRANRTLENIKTMWRFAADEGFVPRASPNPAGSVRKYPEKSRDRWVRHDEMPALLESIEQESCPYLKAVFWTILFTGARISEALGVKWEHVDLDRAELFLPETKNGTDHLVPLSAPAVEVLRGLRRQAGNPFVFCGHVKGRAYTNVYKPWYRIRKRADLEDVRPHDLRRTAAAWLATAGYSELIIKKLLNHSVQGVTGIYARVGPQAVRKAVEDYGQQIVAAAAGDDSNIIPLSIAREDSRS